MATITEFPDFNPEADAKVLRKAMKGFGTNEDAIIAVLAKRTCKQRQRIKRAFYHEFGRDLLDDLKSELSGKLEKVVLGLMMPAAEYDAMWLNKAMKGLGTNESLLIEILCTRTSEELADIRRAYGAEYKTELEADVASEVRGDFEKLLLALITHQRPSDDLPFDKEQAKLDAHSLHKAGEKKRFGTDEDKFIEIFTQRSREHLKVTFEQYGTISDYDIERSIDREMNGDLEKALTTIAQWVRGPDKFFAHRLYKAMDGLGTDDDTLQRILISRAEVDLKEIAAAFNENHDKYKKTLQSWIKDDTRGDYEKILLEILQ